MERNEALAALIDEARLSLAGLARRINELALGEGLELTYDYTAVYRWIRGRAAADAGCCPAHRDGTQ